MTSVTDRQRARILNRLRSHGTTHAGEWKDGGRAVDGGDEITRVAARIEDGAHRIVRAGRTPGRLQIYRLVDVSHVPTARRLPHRPWMTGWLCLNPACLTSWPADYTGTCCGEDRFLIRLTIKPPRVAASTASEVAA